MAGKNAALNGLESKITFLESDLFNCFYDSYGEVQRFDIIVSNPPYIPSDELGRLPIDVQKEPSLALDGGIDGLDYYRRIANEGHFFLKKSGLLFLEIGDGQKKDIEEIFHENGIWKVLGAIKDYTQTERVLVVRLK